MCHGLAVHLVTGLITKEAWGHFHHNKSASNKSTGSIPSLSHLTAEPFDCHPLGYKFEPLNRNQNRERCAHQLNKSLRDKLKCTMHEVFTACNLFMQRTRGDPAKIILRVSRFKFENPHLPAYPPILDDEPEIGPDPENELQHEHDDENHVATELEVGLQSDVQPTIQSEPELEIEFDDSENQTGVHPEPVFQRQDNDDQSEFEPEPENDSVPSKKGRKRKGKSKRFSNPAKKTTQAPPVPGKRGRGRPRKQPLVVVSEHDSDGFASAPEIPDSDGEVDIDLSAWMLPEKRRKTV